jgi:hypothetical protein
MATIRDEDPSLWAATKGVFLDRSLFSGDFATM